MAARVAGDRRDLNLAVAWATKLTQMARQDPKNLILVIADLARSAPPMTPPFVSELSRRLQGQGPALAFPLTWIEQQLAESGLSIEQLVRSGNQQQAADQVSVSNSIGSLRLLGTLDWNEFVEAMSLVEQVLRTDPAGAYAGMDFASRDSYRHAVETIAKASGCPEDAVASQAVALAAAGPAPAGGDREAHVGYYLIDRGLPALEQAMGANLAPAAAMRRWASGSALSLYLGATTVLTLVLAAGLLAQARAEALPAWALVPLAVLATLATGQLAIALVNWLMPLLASPRRLPRMDYSEGIPAESRTLVVVPTLLTSPGNVEGLVEALEVRFLANRDAHLHFGLLTDLRDAAEETLAQDAPLLALAQERHRGPECALRGRPGRHLLSVPSPAPLEPPRPDLDGIRAQARQAGGPQRPAAGRRPRRLLPGRRRHRRALRGALRHHPRHGHPTAARRRSRARRHPGAPAEPGGLRPGTAARGRRLRHPPAGGEREPAEPASRRATGACTAANRA